MISYVLFTGILAGSRPAFYLSSFKPIKVLKGTIQTGRSAVFSRQALVVIQFTCSIALIISTIIIYQQIQYAKDRPTGFDVDRLMMTDASTDLSKNYSALKSDLLKTGVVVSVTKSSSPVTEIWSNNDVLSWQGKRADETLGLATIGVTDADYFKTMGITLTQGRNFTGDLNVDSASVLINEAAVKRMRFKDPINQVITMDGDVSRLTVIGVVKDAMMASPYAPAEPSIFTFSPGWSSMISYRLASHVSTQDALAKLEPVFNKYNPSFPYRYRFADEAYASKFSLETLIGKLAGVFAILAIFISSLGLFGLATYVAEQRKKEIGIRKVLGASVSQVWALLSKDFILLVLTSCIIASPLAFYFLQDWLQKYPYRISIGAGVFIVAAMLAIFITIITISFQAIKAAVANPVKSLRAE
jgi:ABC-type antimicrobial peptide transport system permease subunit